ncbi:hypothetical protein GALL_426070 [mine drainage metagenome]|uniref:Uncharacterized protein n=1 Tax=mine drainage metagenome TaxID=410659 RepID=A0A1J5QIA5_9ZZZZ
MDDWLMTEAPSAINGSRPRVSRYMLATLLCNKADQRAGACGSASSSGVGYSVPALLTRVWTATPRSRRSLASADTAAGSVRSVPCSDAACPPLISRAAAASAAAERSTSSSAAPRVANASAMARPMPPAAPVTRTVRPEKSRSRTGLTPRSGTRRRRRRKSHLPCPDRR